MVWAKKYLSRGFIFAEEPTSSQGILPSHQACGKILRQNTLGTRFGGRNCKTAKINCKFVDTGITTLFLPFRNLRYAGYKQYTWWIHNRLGKGIRRVAPSCVVWKIRNIFPESSGIYIPFTESELWFHEIINNILRVFFYPNVFQAYKNSRFKYVAIKIAVFIWSMDFEWSDENLLRTCFKVEILGDSIGTMLRGRLGISGSGTLQKSSSLRWRHEP